MLARRRLADFRGATGGAIPLVAVGGIDSGAEAYARIRSGASLVQLYTSLVYEGPGLPARILADLDACLTRDGVRERRRGGGGVTLRLASAPRVVTIRGA